MKVHVTSALHFSECVVIGGSYILYRLSDCPRKNCNRTFSINLFQALILKSLIVLCELSLKELIDVIHFNYVIFS